MMYGRSYGLANNCISYFSYWHLILLGVIIISVVIFFLLKIKNDKNLNLLREKFILGEISEDEYLSKKNTLNKK